MVKWEASFDEHYNFLFHATSCLSELSEMEKGTCSSIHQFLTDIYGDAPFGEESSELRSLASNMDGGEVGC